MINKAISALRKSYLKILIAYEDEIKVKYEVFHFKIS